ncbi:hypothetical protein ASZ90_005519 [hydrocarbon metagenome]|uniref:Uncharacterized protein n=1 Tax=hydrocarbon metagenome TaxID=938273 RepID=A0A0W8FUM9_9ZZZZ
MVIYSQDIWQSNMQTQLYNKLPGTEDNDPASVAEWDRDQAIDKYQTLAIIKSHHLLMTSKGYYYEHIKKRA